MKTTLSLLIFSLISLVTYSQDSLKITIDGVAPIVVNIEGKTASELYNKALNWVQTTYKNPESVLKSKIENESIRVDGFSSSAWFYKSMGISNYYDMEYSIEVSFKDGRYRLEFIVGQFYAKGQKVMHQPKHFFKKDGSIAKMYSDAVPSIEQTMNKLSKTFYNYVSGETSKKEDNW
jgi:hypothetical protein